MKWAEVIMVRAADGNTKMLTAALQSLMNDVAKNTRHAPIRVFRREKLDSDICIVVFHRGKKTKTGGSALGLHLAVALMEVGLVNHTIWREIEQ
jgi:hypothetical protein